MVRKRWDQLSPDYRARLERKGITAETHAAGASLYAARGQTSAVVEQDRARYRRSKERFIDRLVVYYGRDEEEIREFLDGLSRSEVENVMARQREMERLYNAGFRDEATALYANRNRNYPDWIDYYHGVFA